jgi:hypothetical protein
MNESRKMRWAGHAACIGAKRTVIKFFLGKPKRK